MPCMRCGKKGIAGQATDDSMIWCWCVACQILRLQIHS